jgi:hypothetical protein
LKTFLTQFGPALPLTLDPPVMLPEDQKCGTTITITIWRAFLPKKLILFSPTPALPSLRTHVEPLHSRTYLGSTHELYPHCTNLSYFSLSRFHHPHGPRSPLDLPFFFSSKRIATMHDTHPAARTTCAADARAHRTSSWSSLWCQRKSLHSVLLSRDHVCGAALCVPQTVLRCSPPGSLLAHCAVLSAPEDMACATLCISCRCRGDSRRWLLW